MQKGRSEDRPFGVRLSIQLCCSAVHRGAQRGWNTVESAAGPLPIALNAMTSNR
jgi:hypothetical protein